MDASHAVKWNMHLYEEVINCTVIAPHTLSRAETNIPFDLPDLISATRPVQYKLAQSASSFISCYFKVVASWAPLKAICSDVNQS